MRFIRTVMFDIKYGICKKGLLLFCPVLIAGMVFADALFQVRRFAYKPEAVSFGDFWFYAYGGMKKYVPSPDNAFEFPVIWLVLFLAVLFLLLNYPVKDLQSTGPQILVRSGGRSGWWLSKCIWNLLATVLYHGIFIGTLFGLCGCFGIAQNLRIDVDLIRIFFELDAGTELLPRNFIPVSVFFLPFLFSAASNMLQMLLTLWLKPMFGFLGVAVFMVASTYLFSAFVPGNYGMPLRFGWIWPDGIPYQYGFAVTLGMILGAAAVGLCYFRRYDILNKE